MSRTTVTGVQLAPMKMPIGAGRVRLVEKIDPVTKKPYYATETKRSDARTATELLT